MSKLLEERTVMNKYINEAELLAAHVEGNLRKMHVPEKKIKETTEAIKNLEQMLRTLRNDFCFFIPKYMQS